MKNLLVTTDFSASSKAAIKFALQLAGQTDTGVIFYHVIEVMKPTSWSAAKYAKFATSKKEEFTEKLRRFVAPYLKASGLSSGRVDYVTEIGTEVTDMVIKAGKKKHASFICVSTRGAGKVRKLLGSNASALIMHSTVPLAVVPESYRPSPVTRLFYASDLARLAEEMRTVKTLADELHAQVTVYHYDYLLNVTQNKSAFERRAKRYLAPGVSFNFKRQAIDISMSEHLQNDIKYEKASAVILFTKQNRNWFDRLLAPSEARKMAFNAHVPLLIFRKKPR